MKTSFFHTLSLTVALAMLALAPQAPAASITNAQSGNFSDTSTWQGGVIPGAADTVFFRNNSSFRTVTWTTNTSLTSLDLVAANATNVLDLAGNTNTMSGFLNVGTVAGGGSMLTVLSSGVTTSVGLKIGNLGSGYYSLMLSNGAVLNNTGGGTVKLGSNNRSFNEMNVLEGARYYDSVNQLTIGETSYGNTLRVGGVFTNIGLVQVGVNAGDHSNLVVVAGPKAVFYAGGGLTLGGTAAQVGNALVVSNGASAYLNNTLTVGRGIMSTNFSVLVEGSNSVLTGSSLLRVNGIGSTILVTNGGRFTIQNDAVIGYSIPGTSNTVVATGSGTLFDVSVSSKGLRVGSNSFATALGNGYVYIRDGATLRANLITAGSNSTGFVRNEGGVYEFTTTAPVIDLSGTADSVTLNNGTVSFRNVADAWMDRQIANITYSGANTLRLDGSTTAFDSAPSVYFLTNGARFSTLELRGTNASWSRTALFVGAGGKLSVTNATGASVTTVVTNQGTISVIGSTVNFKQAVVSSGGIVTDPSTVTYEQNLTLTPNGYINATNDTFVFYKNFINQSTNQPNFNMAQATVRFVSNGLTTAHTYDVTGSGSLNIGQGYTNFSQVAGNFAIGALSIQAGNRLTITGTVGVITNAVYVGWLDIQGLGSGSLLTNNYSQVTNTLVLALNLPNISLFYDKYDGRNDWLTANLTGSSAGGYNLWGGGLLLPIPEPSATVLVLGGAVFGAWLARRRAARG
jgi:hypothetical protein